MTFTSTQDWHRELVVVPSTGPAQADSAGCRPALHKGQPACLAGAPRAFVYRTGGVGRGEQGSLAFPVSALSSQPLCLPGAAQWTTPLILESPTLQPCTGLSWGLCVILCHEFIDDHSHVIS